MVLMDGHDGLTTSTVVLDSSVLTHDVQEVYYGVSG